MFMNPIIATIHNVLTDKWHPVLFVESPLPGPEYPDKPVRHKSKMHHTTGFATRAQSDNSARSELAAQIPGARLELDTVFDWDGDGIPAMVHFFMPNMPVRRGTPSPQVVCSACGKPENHPLHIKYGPDLDNPRKHQFTPNKQLETKKTNEKNQT